MRLNPAICGACVAMLSMTGAAMAAGHGCRDAKATLPENPQVTVALTTELKLDPRVFFQRLVDRYRGLHLYRDIVNVVQVTQRDGEETSRIETRLVCEVADGELKVQTPASQVRKGLGLDLPVKKSEPAKQAQKEYDLWLAPHMALKFTDEPLKQLRSGVDEGFTPIDAEPITIDNKRMVHVELRGGSGAGMSEHHTAKVDLYVNSDSMLIERIESEQRLPDGASYSTRLEITPEQAEGDIPAEEPTAVPVQDTPFEPAT